MSDQERLTSSLATAGIENLRQALASSGLVVRHHGEPFNDFCVRVASEYYISAQDASSALQHFR